MSPINNPLEKRTNVYVNRPKDYEISGCSCGNNDPEWSEYKGHLWCDKCQKDFKPECGGVFDGPICVNLCKMFGISFNQINIKTQQLEPFNG